MRLLADKRFPKAAWKRVVGTEGGGSTEATSLRLGNYSGLFPREALLRRATLGLYEGTALPFLEDGP
jgi:hypothetical protein